VKGVALDKSKPLFEAIIPADLLSETEDRPVVNRVNPRGSGAAGEQAQDTRPRAQVYDYVARSDDLVYRLAKAGKTYLVSQILTVLIKDQGHQTYLQIAASLCINSLSLAKIVQGIMWLFPASLFVDAPPCIVSFATLPYSVSSGVIYFFFEIESPRRFTTLSRLIASSSDLI
jgi:hypothetical protein